MNNDSQYNDKNFAICFILFSVISLIGLAVYDPKLIPKILALLVWAIVFAFIKITDISYFLGIIFGLTLLCMMVTIALHFIG